MSDYCRDCDPMIVAPGFACTSCGGEALPLDAEYVPDPGGHLILARYEQWHVPPCAGPRDWTALVDPQAHTGEELRHAPADGADRARQHYLDQYRCTAATAQGTRCRLDAKDGGLCGTHIAQRARQQRRRRQGAGS